MQEILAVDAVATNELHTNVRLPVVEQETTVVNAVAARFSDNLIDLIGLYLCNLNYHRIHLFSVYIRAYKKPPIARRLLPVF
jgi:hypothetical protein